MTYKSYANKTITLNDTLPTTQQYREISTQADSCTINEHHGLRVVNAYHQMGYAGTLPKVYSRYYVQQSLQRIVADLLPNAGLMIFDAYRSITTQAAIFTDFSHLLALLHPQCSPDKIEQLTREFASVPDSSAENVSLHNTGGSIDLAIYDIATGQPWDFGSAFDATVELSHTTFFEREYQAQYGIPQSRWINIRHNRRILYHLMCAQGFTNFSNEWWHYDVGNRLWASLLNTDTIYISMPLTDEVSPA